MYIPTAWERNWIGMIKMAIKSGMERNCFTRLERRAVGGETRMRHNRAQRPTNTREKGRGGTTISFSRRKSMMSIGELFDWRRKRLSLCPRLNGEDEACVIRSCRSLASCLMTISLCPPAPCHSCRMVQPNRPIERFMLVLFWIFIHY